MRIESRLLPDTLPFLGDLPPLLTRLYASRGVGSEAELDKSLARPGRRRVQYRRLVRLDAGPAAGGV
ncbi:MAG: recJ, partial [Pseudomonas sp.]|nr:recJ [Pseudomonas sp.]